jgi:hypothetical protein
MLLLLSELDGHNKLKSVLENIYTGLEKMFDSKQSNFLEQCLGIEQDLKSSKSYDNLVFNAYKEVLENERTVFNSLDGLKFEDLKGVGLIGAQLDLKIKLYREQLNKVVKRAKDKFYDFSDKVLQKFFSGQLDYLPDLLGSLLKLIPGLEPLVEFLQSIRSLVKQMNGGN